MAEPSPNPRALLEYDVVATADLTASGGFQSLAPPGGFHDAGSGPHFFQLRCLFCGEETKADVAVYTLARGARPCTERYGPRMLVKRCHPTCPNPSHIVKKCASSDCRALGSIELLEVNGSLKQGRTHFLTVKALGYQVLKYSPGQKWEATSGTGEVVPISYCTGVFNGLDTTDCRIAIRTKFSVIRQEG